MPWRTHGGITGEMEGFLRESTAQTGPILDMSVNLNYYGPSPRVQKVVADAKPWHYPRADYLFLKKKLQERHPEKLICVGNGAVDLLWTCAQAFVARGFSGVVIEPTFCEFKSGWMAALKTAQERDIRQRLFEWRTTEKTGFKLDLKALSSWLGTLKKPIVVYLCNPNSPTGTAIDPRHIEQMVKNLSDTWLILDEAFWTLSDIGPYGRFTIPWEGRQTSSRLIHLRSMTKDHALAGLRLGYLAANSEVVRWIEEHRPPWMLNSVAEEAFGEALNDDKFVEDSWRKIGQDREYMVELLKEAGFMPFPSSTMFMMLKVPSAEYFKSELLLQHRILVRSMTSYELPHFLRICTRPAHEAHRLVEALISVQKSWKNGRKSVRQANFRMLGQM